MTVATTEEWHHIIYYLVTYSVMQKELDKIERFASEVTEKSKMKRASADKLLVGVKVGMWTI